MIFFLLSIFNYNLNLNGGNVYYSGYKSSSYNLFSFFKKDIYAGYINLKDIRGNKGLNAFYISRDSIYRDYKILIGDFSPKAQLPFSSYPRMRGIKLSNHKNVSIYSGRIANKQYSLFPEFSENRYFLLFDIKPKSIPAFKPFFSFSIRDNKEPERNKIFRMTGNFLFKPSEYWNIDNKTSFGILRNNENQPFLGINTRYNFRKQDFLLLGRSIFISPHYITPYLNIYSKGRQEIYLLLNYRYPSNFGIGEGVHFSNCSGIRGLSFTGAISYKSTISYLPSIKCLGRFEIDGQPFDANLITSKGVEISGNMKFLYYNLYYQKTGKRKMGRISFRISPSPSYKVMFNLNRVDSILKHYYSFYISPYKNFSMSTAFYFTNTKIDGGNLNLKFSFPKNLNMKIETAYYSGYLNISSALNVSGGVEKFGFSTLEGIAFIDKNGNKKFDSGESPWKNISIIMDEKDTTKTDNQGRYRFHFISSGPHTVRVDFRNIPANYGEWTYIKKFTANIWGKIQISFPLSPLGMITGKIFYDTNGNGEWDKGEKGVPNVIVFVKNTPSLSITDDNGVYRLYNFPPGAYIIGVRNLPRGYTLNPPNLLIYAYLRPGMKKTNMSFGIIKRKRPIRKKIFR